MRFRILVASDGFDIKRASILMVSVNFVLTKVANISKTP